MATSQGQTAGLYTNVTAKISIKTLCMRHAILGPVVARKIEMFLKYIQIT